MSYIPSCLCILHAFRHYKTFSQYLNLSNEYTLSISWSAYNCVMWVSIIAMMPVSWINSTIFYEATTETAMKEVTGFVFVWNRVKKLHRHEVESMKFINLQALIVPSLLLTVWRFINFIDSTSCLYNYYVAILVSVWGLRALTPTVMIIYQVKLNPSSRDPGYWPAKYYTAF